MLAYCTSTASNSGKNTSSAYSILQRRHTIHPKERKKFAHSFILCVLFHFLPFCSCDHVNYLRWTSIEFYWQTSTTKSKSLKYLSWQRTTCTHGEQVKKITAINNLQRFVFFLARHLLRRKIWLTCMCEASVPCMCLYVYTLYLSRTFILSIKT